MILSISTQRLPPRNGVDRRYRVGQARCKLQVACFDMYMSLAPLISCDLGNLAHRDKSRVFSRTAIS
jgi:hypothetical protein